MTRHQPSITSAAPGTPFRTGRDVRLAARAGMLDGPTAGLAPGYLQANLVLLPAEHAEAFRQFCALNAQACPVVGVSESGSRDMPSFAEDLDLARDVPRYRVWKHGVVDDEPQDARSFWRDDLVSVALGCSFSFEDALQEAGLPVRHIGLGCNVPMFRTAVPCIPSGPFAGPLVVSMRPFPRADVARVAAITGRFTWAHGAPVHVGDPATIGIRDLNRPDYGDAVPIAPGEVPVFWACGVTPQAALQHARLPFAITHAPGCMLISDRLNAQGPGQGSVV